MVGTLEEPRWRYVERVVGLLEKSLDPSATVQHNIKLPVLDSPKDKRQCDVVITFGQSPRQTVTIVEVQARKKKVGVGTLDGWVAKMREVGAQHLICVSEAGYTDRVAKKVNTIYGPTVRLLTLTELDIPTFPGVELVDHVLHDKPRVTFEDMGVIKLNVDISDVRRTQDAVKDMRLQFPGVIHEKMFEIDGVGERLALTGLMDIILPKMRTSLRRLGKTEANSYTVKFVLNSEGDDLWFCVGEERFKVLELPVEVSVERHLTRVPLRVVSYQQEFHDNVLAWIALVKGIVDGEDIDIKVVFMRGDDGILKIVGREVVGVDNVKLLWSVDQSS